MKAKTILTTAILGLAACATQVPGVGQLSTGEPLSVLMATDVDNSGFAAVVDIESPEGWSCKADIGQSAPSQKGSARSSVPMTCSDGATGVMLLTFGGGDRSWNGAFKLSNGRSGQVTINMKPPI